MLNVSTAISGDPDFLHLFPSIPPQKATIQNINDGQRFNAIRCIGGTISAIMAVQGIEQVKEFIRQNKLSQDTHKGSTNVVQISLKDKRNSGSPNTIRVYFFSSWAQKLSLSIKKNDQLQLWGDDVIATRDPCYVGGIGHRCHVVVTSLKSAHAKSNTVGPSVHVLVLSQDLAHTKYIHSTAQEELLEYREKFRNGNNFKQYMQQQQQNGGSGNGSGSGSGSGATASSSHRSNNGRSGSETNKNTSMNVPTSNNVVDARDFLKKKTPANNAQDDSISSSVMQQQSSKRSRNVHGSSSSNVHF